VAGDSRDHVLPHAALVLKDGTVWKGKGFGAPGTVTGEVVFNTGMTGYTQAVTDCSYKGQILCQTYPLIGNYGICSSEFESDGPKIQGYAVYEACSLPSHRTSEKGLAEWLAEAGIPGIQGIDTRELTKNLRVSGTMMGALYAGADPPDIGELARMAAQAQDPNERDLVAEVTIREPMHYPGKKENVVVIDCGAKLGIISSLLETGVSVTRVPASFTAGRIMDLRPDGVVISNGPGDPKKVQYVIDTVKALMEHRVPVFGVCLGNQILGLALGCDTYKLKFGHRGQNHPVMEASTGRCYITSQNHGFAIDRGSIAGSGARATFTNINDGTVEGIEHERLSAFGVQFHPEVRPGPLDTKFLLDRFVKHVGRRHAKG